jgi:hypothetical protein
LNRGSLFNAARIPANGPATMQLRHLQSLAEIGVERNSTIVFPMPIDIIKPFPDLMQSRDALSSRNGVVHECTAT